MDLKTKKPKCGDIMIRTFKVEIYPTAKQRKAFAQAFGTRRWVWNWALATYEEHWDSQNLFMTSFMLDTLLNSLRESNPDEYGWIGEVNTMVKSEALKDFGLATKAWCKQLKAARQKPTKVNANKGKPKFKKKGYCEESFRLFKKNDSMFRVKSQYHFNFTWTRAYGRMTVRTAESLLFLKDAEIKTMTISQKCGKYFMSLAYEKANRPRARKEGVIGLDLGIKHSAVTYDGHAAKTYDLPKSIARYERLYDSRQTKLSAKTYGSKAYEKQKLLCDKAAAKQARIRKDFLHKLTTELVTNYSEIKIDDFSFKGYVAIQRNARHAYSVAPCTLKEMLEYKAEELGVVVKFVPKGTPTTQTCSCCGHRLEGEDKLSLNARRYVCPKCGQDIDRDVNAAISVFKLPIE